MEILMSRHRRPWTEGDVKFFFIILIVVTVISFLFPPKVKADDVTLTWTNPVDQESCTNAGPTTIDGVNIWQLVGTIPSVDTTYTIPAVKPGSYTYAASAFNASGESRLSGVTTKDVTAFTVTDQRVYIVAKTNGRFLLLVVGTVPLGTACDPNIEINGMNVVPVDQVTFTGARDVVVVAKCG